MVKAYCQLWSMPADRRLCSLQGLQFCALDIHFDEVNTIKAQRRQGFVDSHGFNDALPGMVFVDIVCNTASWAPVDVIELQTSCAPHGMLDKMVIARKMGVEFPVAFQHRQVARDELEGH